MAAASPAPDRAMTGLSEDSPLLGGPGAASQPEGKPLYHNLFIGTAILAQFGIIILVCLVFASIFLHPLSLFSLHPLFNISGLLLITEALLLLQPTHTEAQKTAGAVAHGVLNTLALLLLLTAFVIIEYNKFNHGAIHFTSVHGIMGLITYIFVFNQTVIGATLYWVPAIYGGVDKAKSFYKIHRANGYAVITLAMGTVAAATQTETGMKFLKLKLWAVLVCVVLILLGVVPRIRKAKFGF